MFSDHQVLSCFLWLISFRCEQGSVTLYLMLDFIGRDVTNTMWCLEVTATNKSTNCQMSKLLLHGWFGFLLIWWVLCELHELRNILVTVVYVRTFCSLPTKGFIPSLIRSVFNIAHTCENMRLCAKNTDE
ncbi:hypothetical protein Drorol1_Dr00009346 [Drosera rotundifolia]